MIIGVTISPGPVFTRVVAPVVLESLLAELFVSSTTCPREVGVEVEGFEEELEEELEELLSFEVEPFDCWVD
jgi:hypothetical protein